MQNHAKLAAGAQQGHMAKPEQVPALVCDTYARRILCAATIWGGWFALYEQNNPPKCLGIKSEILIKFHHPPPSKPIVSR